MSDQNNGQSREESRTRPFNPNEHVMQIKNKGGAADYLPVQWRLVWFRNECPQGTIETELVHLDLDRETEEETYVWSNEKRRSEKVVKTAKGIAVFRAIAKDGKGGVATGTKSEKAASFSDYIEKAETGAIGRALAALGYGTQFAPELDEEHRIVDSPVDRSQNGNGNGSRPAQPTAPAKALAAAKPAAPAAKPTRFDEEDDDDSEEGDEPAATKQQLDSIEKLCQRLGKPVERPATFAQARETIGRLTAEYRTSKAKAS